MSSNKFWVEPCLTIPHAFVIYRNNGREILVRTQGGMMKTTKEMLTPEENRWFNKNIMKDNA